VSDLRQVQVPRVLRSIDSDQGAHVRLRYILVILVMFGHFWSLLVTLVIF